jgi:hypothetical protein
VFNTEPLTISIIISAVVAGLFGALKYYSNTLGTNPETFDMRKFIPILIISVVVSIGMVVSGGDMATAEGLRQYIEENFIVVIFANTALTIIEKWYAGRKAVPA